MEDQLKKLQKEVRRRATVWIYTEKIKDLFFIPNTDLSRLSVKPLLIVTIKIEISRGSSYFGALGGIIVSHLTSPHELTVKIIKHLAV